jgi:hypothetical protein
MFISPHLVWIGPTADGEFTLFYFIFSSATVFQFFIFKNNLIQVDLIQLFYELIIFRVVLGYNVQQERLFLLTMITKV